MRYNQGIFQSQLVAGYGRSKDQNYDPKKGRYADSATMDDVKQYTAVSMLFATICSRSRLVNRPAIT
ncbi:hypothetical protein, partial [Enterobacter sp. BH2-YP2023]|uniref:hypothetical protein n=1 Tax=Enterobacter sp. BH2-YP2023 TaxID=3402818 RepID=UPI003D73FBE9